jgi:hypothetical protein
MQFLVIGDTHGDTSLIKFLLKKYAKSVQAVFHMGDHDWDLLQFAPETEQPLIAVAGNCDDGTLSPFERTITVEGKRVLMLHGNRVGVNASLTRLRQHAQKKEAGICLYGHTHSSAAFTRENILYMNPGSLYEPRDGSPPSYGLLTIDEKTGEASGEIIFL